MSNLAISAPVFLWALTIHEFAHAWVAHKCGDDTALYEGRVSLNPLVHLDPIGTLCMLFVGFGWAKPVPVNPYNFRNYRRDDILVSLAGVTANLLNAILFAILFGLLMRWFEFGYLHQMAAFGVLGNLGLMFFNLIPIPPLDGSHVLYQMLPTEMKPGYRQVAQYGQFILIALIFTGITRVLIWTPTMYVARVLFGVALLGV